jgi:hypothetical protein
MAERPPTGQVGGGGSSPELLADRKGGKNGIVAAFSDEVGAPVAGGVLCRGGKEEEAQAQLYKEKKAARGPRGSAHRGGVRDGGGGRTTAVARGTEAWCSDSDVVGFGHERRHGRTERARGEARTASAARRRLRILAGWNGF